MYWYTWIIYFAIAIALLVFMITAYRDWLWPNNSVQATPVGRPSSVFAVGITLPAMAALSTLES